MEVVEWKWTDSWNWSGRLGELLPSYQGGADDLAPVNGPAAFEATESTYEARRWMLSRCSYPFLSAALRVTRQVVV